MMHSTTTAWCSNQNCTTQKRTQCYGTDPFWAQFLVVRFKNCIMHLLCLCTLVLQYHEYVKDSAPSRVSQVQQLELTIVFVEQQSWPKHARPTLDKKKVGCKSCLLEKKVAGRVGLQRSVFSTVHFDSTGQVYKTFLFQTDIASYVYSKSVKGLVQWCLHSGP